MIITDGRFWEIYYGSAFAIIFSTFAGMFYWFGGPYWAAILLTVLTAASIYRCGKKQSVLLEPDKHTITTINDTFTWKKEQTYSIDELTSVSISELNDEGSCSYDIKLMGLAKPIHLKHEKKYSDACAIQGKVAAYLGIPILAKTELRK